MNPSAPKNSSLNVDYGRLDVLDDSKFGDEFKEEARTRKMTDREWLKDASERILGRQLSDNSYENRASAGAKWRTQLASGSSRDDIMDQMIKSDEYQARDAAVKKYRVEKGGENPEEKWLDARVGAQGWKEKVKSGWKNNETGDYWESKGKWEYEPGYKAGPTDERVKWDEDPRLQQYTKVKGEKYTADTLFDSKKSPNLDNKDNPPMFGGKEPKITLPEVPPKGKETQPERKSQEQASGVKGGNWVKGLVKGVKEKTGLTTSATSDLNREKEAAIKQGVSQNELREMEQKHRDGGYSSTPSRGSIERETFKPRTNTFTPRKRVETPDYSYQETNKAKSDRGKDFVDKFTSGYSGLRSDDNRESLLTGSISSRTTDDNEARQRRQRLLTGGY